MKKEKLQGKSERELTDLLREKKESLQKFRFGVTGSKVRNIKEGRNLRREIARILTELRKRVVS